MFFCPCEDLIQNIFDPGDLCGDFFSWDLFVALVDLMQIFVSLFQLPAALPKSIRIPAGVPTGSFP